jgi:hypothetical protein
MGHQVRSRCRVSEAREKNTAEIEEPEPEPVA